ncbi:DUF1700 domain-containing protein [Halobacillus aidingensis]|uniref:Uncharacterized membrane protein n=1 Tax=Halobacillus aidingensis TaxID=240303 RepID=A0A1H0LZN9_HALAD|nr:DUF1700 domain-containing protein [Halobacillus aidingensis]SDO73692.1 Uncharacterized membrane protein [Halobacillus aidingensis]
MRQELFLQRLKHALSNLPEEEREEIILDYKEYIDSAVGEGRGEEEVISHLGKPEKIAQEIKAETIWDSAEKDRSVTQFLRALAASLSISFFNIILVLGPAVGVFTLYVGFLMGSIVLSLSPFVFGFSLLMENAVFIPAEFFLSIVLGSLGVMLTMGLWFAGKKLYLLSLIYLRFNKKMMMGESH